jgi:hypothetical protein
MPGRIYDVFLLRNPSVSGSRLVEANLFDFRPFKTTMFALEEILEISQLFGTVYWNRGSDFRSRSGKLFSGIVWKVNDFLLFKFL